MANKTQGRTPAKTPGKTVRLPDDVHEDIITTIKAVTGVRPVMLDFVLEALEEKLRPYREQLAARQNAGSDSRRNNNRS